MSDEPLLALAAALGLEARWTDAEGRRRDVSVESLRALAMALGYPAGSAAEIAESRERRARETQDAVPPLIVASRGRATPLADARLAGTRFRIDLENGDVVEGRLGRDAPTLPPLAVTGYHRVHIGGQTRTLAVAPPRCFSIEDLPASARRRWGLTAQIYALRRDGDGGIGDFGALNELAGIAAAAGADALAISPVHAMFGAAPDRCSPYSPSSRLFLNALLADPRERFGEAEVGAAIGAARLGPAHALESVATIDWPHAAARKLALLRELYRAYLRAGSPHAAAFEDFRARGGEALARHAEFEALHARFMHEGGSDWHAWLAREAGRDDEDEIRFHAFLQWLPDNGLAAAQRRAREDGMAIGLITDLAVGSDPEGSDACARRSEMLARATIGAPPDVFNSEGQGWGLTTLSPLAMRAHGYRSFIDILRAAMRHGGGVRIDHAMSLMRLWVIPEGASPLEGAYLACPLEDLLRLLALESWRHRAIVIGEDLGVVPAGFRERIRRAGMLGMEVLFFMVRGEHFLPPRRWRRRAVAMTTTHDLPTLAGWWRGVDLDVRERIGLLRPDAAPAERERRRTERRALAHAINAAGSPKRLLAESAASAFVDSAIGFVGASRSELALVPIEDIAGLEMQQNVPGTVDVHPNWRQRLPAPAPRLLASADAERRLHVLAEARSRP